MTTQYPNAQDDALLSTQERERRQKMQAEVERINQEYVERAKTEREAAAAKSKAEQEAFEKERADRLEAEMKAAAKLHWIGTDAEFEKEWPTLRMELLRDRVKKQSDTARDDFGKMVRSFF